jgi:iron complex transport system permease protein
MPIRADPRTLPSFRLFVIALLAAFCVLVTLASVGIGSVRVSPGNVFRALFVEKDGVNRQVIMNIRLPRTLIAGLVGMCLALSGCILQGVMRNPLAAPNLIGVSSGAGLAAVFVYIVFPTAYYLLTPLAFVGSLATTLLIYGIAWKGGTEPFRLILSGVAVSAFLSAGINTLMILYPDRVHSVVSFMVGSLSALTWKHFDILWPYALGGFLVTGLLANRLDILVLGDETARGLGLRVEATRMAFIILSSLLAAAAVSIVGLLGFIGLIVPHMCRLIIGSNHRYLLPASALMGAAVVMLSDIAARTALSPQELPVGIVTAALGAPFFLYLLRKGIRNDGH